MNLNWHTAAAVDYKAVNGSSLQ